MSTLRHPADVVRFDGLLILHYDKAISTDDFAAQAEPLARNWAESGDYLELIRLAAVLAAKAQGLRETGRAGQAEAAEAECLCLLDRACDAGDDRAYGMLTFYLRQFPASSAALAARGGFKLPDVRPIKQAITEELPVPPAPDLGGFPLPTRRERVRWWFEDRWWDVRSVYSNIKWELTWRLWWPLSDAFHAWKDRK